MLIKPLKANIDLYGSTTESHNHGDAKVGRILLLLLLCRN